MSLNAFYFEKQTQIIVKIQFQIYNSYLEIKFCLKLDHRSGTFWFFRGLDPSFQELARVLLHPLTFVLVVIHASSCFLRPPFIPVHVQSNVYLGTRGVFFSPRLLLSHSSHSFKSSLSISLTFVTLYFIWIVVLAYFSQR